MLSQSVLKRLRPGLGLLLLILIAAASPNAWRHKAVSSTAEASTIVGGFSKEQRQLYSTAIVRLKIEHRSPGGYSIQEIIANERSAEGRTDSRKSTEVPSKSAPPNGSGSAHLVFFSILTVVILVIWGARRLVKRDQQRVAAAAAASLAREEAGRRRQSTEAHHAEQRRWDQAKEASEASAVVNNGALIMQPGEVIGFAATAKRILTHKIGHSTERASSRASRSDGTNQRITDGDTKSAGFGAWGMRDGVSQRQSQGNGTHDSTSTSQGSGQTYSHDDVRTEVVDRGQLILTNQRVVFLGDSETLEIPSDKIIGFHFNEHDDLVVDYPKRPKGECFSVPDALSLKMAMVNRLHEPGITVPPRP